MIPPKYKLLFALNPLSRFFESFRALLFGRTPLPVASLSIACVVTLIVLTVSVVVFKKMERSFADVI